MYMWEGLGALDKVDINSYSRNTGVKEFVIWLF